VRKIRESSKWSNPNRCMFLFITIVCKYPPTKMPLLGRLAYDECNQAKLERFQNELISCISMQQFMSSNAIKTICPWEMESNS